MYYRRVFERCLSSGVALALLWSSVQVVGCFRRPEQPTAATAAPPPPAPLAAPPSPPKMRWEQIDEGQTAAFKCDGGRIKFVYDVREGVEKHRRNEAPACQISLRKIVTPEEAITIDTFNTLPVYGKGEKIWTLEAGDYFTLIYHTHSWSYVTVYREVPDVSPETAPRPAP